MHMVYECGRHIMFTACIRTYVYDHMTYLITLHHWLDGALAPIGYYREGTG